MWFGVVSIFPEMFTAITNYGINKRALQQNLVSLKLYNPRHYTANKHARVDDKPYGGGPGMVMQVEPLVKAVVAAKHDSEDLNLKNTIVIYLSPQGKKITQQHLRKTVNQQDGLIFICGRYEGIDERLHQLIIDQEWSIGDFILSGGEIAAMCCIDGMIRLIPGALGDMNSSMEDSFGEDNLLDYPHYTRPQSIYGLEVPKVLLSGHHDAIKQWKQEQRQYRTKIKRKDLLGEQPL
jgi:tRNA (guanine37-N1)-methyltransferase